MVSNSIKTFALSDPCAGKNSRANYLIYDIVLNVLLMSSRLTFICKNYFFEFFFFKMKVLKISNIYPKKEKEKRKREIGGPIMQNNVPIKCRYNALAFEPLFYW